MIMAIQDYYTDLQAYQVTQGADEYGDTVTTFGEPVSFSGYIGKPSSAAVSRMAQRNIVVTGRLYMPTGAPVSEFSVIVEPGTGSAFQVVSEPRDAARRGHHLEADLIEWRGGVIRAD